MTAFYVIGALTALWAVLLAVLGITRPRFPGGGGGAKIVMGISAVFVAATVTAGIVGGIVESGHAEDEAAHEAEEVTGDAPAEEAAAEEGETIELSADPSGELAFDTETLEAQPGTVTLAMANPAPIPHNVSIEGPGVDEQGEVVEEGGTSEVTAEVEPGEYAYYCSVSGHREGGMEGTLTVADAEGGGAGDGAAPQQPEAGQGG